MSLDFKRLKTTALMHVAVTYILMRNFLSIGQLLQNFK